MRWLKNKALDLWRQEQAAAFTEQLLAASLIGVGVIAGLAAVRGELLNELAELVTLINAIKP